MLAGKAMQSKLINLSEIINNNVSCENKDHRHRKPYNGNFLLSQILHRMALRTTLPTAAADCHEGLPIIVGDTGPVRKTIKILSIKICLKCTSSFGLRPFYKRCSEKFGLNIWAPIPIHYVWVQQWHSKQCNLQSHGHETRLNVVIL